MLASNGKSLDQLRAEKSGTITYFLNNDSTKAMYDEDYW